MDTILPYLSFFLYPACGALAGFMAGLLGIGGGLVIVPVLSMVFTWQGMPLDTAMLYAVATSLASILLTSVSSARAHYRRGSLFLPALKIMAPGLMLGTLGGAFLAPYLPGNFLSVFFLFFALAAGTQMLVEKSSKEEKKASPSLSVNVPTFCWATGIGAISSFVGIGGGTLMVPFFRARGLGMRQAVGTSAALGFPIALAGSLGYGLQYIDVWAALGIGCLSILTAPLGAKLAHTLPVGTLKKSFALFLYITALNVFFKLM